MSAVSLSSVLIAAGVGFAAPAYAQGYDPSEDTGVTYPRQQPGRAQSATRANEQPSATGEDASIQQLQTSDGRRYTADQITSDANDRVKGRQESRTDDDDAALSTADGNGSSRSRIRDTGTRTRRPAPPSEFETFASGIAERPLRRFGANLLVPTSRDFAAPPVATVPLDYRINPGDQLVVGLTGSVNADSLRLRVNNDGRIFLPRVGAVTVAGVRYGDVASVIEAQVSRQYRGFRVSVDLGELHGLTVYVTGFAQTPGSYTVSSLSTLVNAVLAAGGPSAGGSFRSIQLRRGGRLVSDFDLYDLLLKGDTSHDATLQNGDVIYIAPVGAQVAVTGSVNNEAVFEARSDDTLTDVLRYAGGVNTVADDSRLLLLDPFDLTRSWQQLTPLEAQSQIAHRAAVLRVLSGVGIARPLGSQQVLVTVNGEVAHPGRFYLPAGTSLGAALAQAGGLTRDAYAYGTVFTRASLRQQQQASYDRALHDTLFLLTITPLTSALQNDANAISRGQALRSAVEQLQQSRPEGRLVLQLAPESAAVPGDMVLENNDAIYVPPRPVTVGVFGSVPSPASFRIQVGRTIGDYVKLAGGVQKVGDKGQIFVVRANGTLLAPHRGVFSGSILSARALPGDLIYVPINASRGEFWARLRDLTQVLFTGSVAAAASVVAIGK